MLINRDVIPTGPKKKPQEHRGKDDGTSSPPFPSEMPSPATTVSSSSASTRTNLRMTAPSDGSRTLVIAQSGHGEEGNRDEPPRQPLPSGTLRLRGGPRSRPQVAWDVDVVDNENMGKKKSKICCIYHKPKAFDESSDEDSSSDSDSDNDPATSDDGRARPSRGSRRQHRCSHNDHNHSSTQRSTDSSDTVITQHHHYHHHRHPDKPNAYETQPPTKGARHTNGN